MFLLPTAKSSVRTKRVADRNSYLECDNPLAPGRPVEGIFRITNVPIYHIRIFWRASARVLGRHSLGAFCAAAPGGGSLLLIAGTSYDF